MKKVKERLGLVLGIRMKLRFYFCHFDSGRDEYEDSLTFNCGRLPTNTNYKISIATGAHVTNKLPDPRDLSTSSPVNSHSTQFAPLRIYLTV